jgi:hypothetical protein
MGSTPLVFTKCTRVGNELGNAFKKLGNGLQNWQPTLSKISLQRMPAGTMKMVHGLFPI